MRKQCTNIVVVKCTDALILNKILAQISLSFDCYMSDQIDLFHWEIEFVSEDSFSKDIFEEITSPYTKSKLYIQVITYELPDEYLEHHIFKDGIWINKIEEIYKLKNKE